jgi:hypothetical protein
MPRNPSRTLVERGAVFNPATTAGTYYAAGQPVTLAPVLATGNAAAGSFYLEPDDYIGTRLRMRVTTFVNDVAPVSNYTVSLHRVLTVSGGAALVAITVDTAVTGSTVVHTAPGANSLTHTETEEFNWPSISGWYVFRFVNSATGTASSSVQWNVQLEVR